MLLPVLFPGETSRIAPEDQQDLDSMFILLSPQLLPQTKNAVATGDQVACLLDSQICFFCLFVFSVEMESSAP